MLNATGLALGIVGIYFVIFLVGCYMCYKDER